MFIFGILVHKYKFYEVLTKNQDGIIKDKVQQLDPVQHGFSDCFPGCLDLDECPFTFSPNLLGCVINSDLDGISRLRIYDDHEGDNDHFIGYWLEKFLTNGDTRLTARFVLNNLWYFELAVYKDDKDHVVSKLFGGTIPENFEQALEEMADNCNCMNHLIALDQEGALDKMLGDGLNVYRYPDSHQLSDYVIIGQDLEIPVTQAPDLISNLGIKCTVDKLLDRLQESEQRSQVIDTVRQRLKEYDTLSVHVIGFDQYVKKPSSMTQVMNERDYFTVDI